MTKIKKIALKVNDNMTRLCYIPRRVRLFVIVAEDYRVLFSHCDQIERSAVGAC
jgi:hypothetical protein